MDCNSAAPITLTHLEHYSTCILPISSILYLTHLTVQYHRSNTVFLSLCSSVVSSLASLFFYLSAIYYSPFPSLCIYPPLPLL